MKKIFALLLALCLLCLSASALAEAVTEAKTVQLDGFSLNLEAGEYYEVADPKVANEIYVLVYPYFGDGDQATNYNIVWAGSPFELTVDQMKVEAANVESTFRSTFEEMGVAVDSFAAGEPYEATINGLDCIAIEFTIRISYLGQVVDIFERQIAVGSIGYTFTLSAASADDLEKLTQTVVNALTFN